MDPSVEGVCGFGAGTSLGHLSCHRWPTSSRGSRRACSDPPTLPPAVDMAGRKPGASSFSPETHTLPPLSVPQLVSEKVGGAEGTKLDDDFKEMEKVTGEVVCPLRLALFTGPSTDPVLTAGAGEAQEDGLDR